MKTKIKENEVTKFELRKVEKRSWTKDVLARWLNQYLIKRDDSLFSSKNQLLRDLLGEIDAFRYQKCFALTCLHGERGTYKLFSLSEVVCIQSEGSYSHVYFVDNTDVLCSYSLVWVEKRLNSFNPSGFVRVHNSHIINLAHFDYLSRGEIKSSMFGKTVPVGRAYRQNLTDKMIMLGQTKNK